MASSKDKLLDTAVSQIRAHGYAATTVDAICAAAGVAKGSFYHHFDSKESLALAALDRYASRNQAILMEGPFREIADGRARLAAFLEHAQRQAGAMWRDGCMLQAVGLEFAAGTAALQEKVAAILKAMTEELAPLFGAAAGKGPGQSARELAEHFLCVVEGGIALARANQETDHIIRAIKHFRRYIEGMRRE